jgi:transposase InsO family protein
MVKVPDKMRLYYDLAKQSAVSTLHKLQPAAAIKGNKTKKKSKVKHLLLQQDAYNSLNPSCNKFQRSPYTVTNIENVWEADLADVRALSKYNDGFNYLLTVIDVFSKYTHPISLRSKTGPEVSSAFATMLAKTKYKPLWVRTDNGKEFLYATFQGILKKKGI